MKNYLPKISLSKIQKTTAGIIFTVLVFYTGYALGNKNLTLSVNEYPKVNISRDLPDNQKELDFDLFWKVWDTLGVKYYDKSKLIPSQMVYGAISGMVAAVGDPYTVFLTPSNNKVVQEDLQGSFDGIGIQIGFKGTQLAVIAPLPGSPAEKAGVEAGDLIVGIRDEKKNIDTGTVGITLPDAVQMIRGERGTTVELALLREGEDELIVIEITRDSIEVPSVVLEYVGERENIAHIKVLKFGGETKAEWDNAVIEALTKKDLGGIILDVRNNPGGYLHGAVELGTDFLEVGSVVVIEETYTGEKNEFKVEDLGRLRNQKTIVLVNKGSASSSEILAGALRDDRGIILVGEKTFGKGTIQEPQQINGGAGLHITIARWLTPDGIWVDQEGLTPDHELEDNPDTEEDEQLEKAIELINNI